MSGSGTKSDPCVETIECQENELIAPCANFECYSTCSGHLNYQNASCPNGAITCDYQSYLDEYCSKMSPVGEGEFLCSRAKDVPPMKARVGFNKNGAALAWRCYGNFRSTNEENACIGSDGLLTNEERGL